MQFWWCFRSSREARHRGYWHWEFVHFRTCSQSDFATWQWGVYWHWPSAAWHLDAWRRKRSHRCCLTMYAFLISSSVMGLPPCPCIWPPCCALAAACCCACRCMTAFCCAGVRFERFIFWPPIPPAMTCCCPPGPLMITRP